MAKYVIEDTTLTGIADAIRGKNGSTDTYKPEDMPSAIGAIETGSSTGNAVALKLNTVATYTTPTGKYHDTRYLKAGYGAGVTDGTSLNYIWYKKTFNGIWPINNYRWWIDGHQIRILFYVWCSEGELTWGNKNVYVNSNYTYVHSLDKITTTPQLIDFTFTYENSGSSYEPTIHIYPNYSDSNIKIYCSPIQVVDLNAALTADLYRY